MDTFDSILQRFTTFLTEHFESLKEVITTYFDILFLYISLVNDKRLAVSATTNLVDLLIKICDFLSPQQLD